MSTRERSGRGTGIQPPNRFEELHFEADPDLEPEEEAPPVPTKYYRDASRSILAENQSPDVGFRFSLNPYRGCEHGCVYCLAPETPVLHADMTWRPLGDVRVGDELVGFDEHAEPGHARKMRRSVVERVWWSRRPTLRLCTTNTEVRTTAEHRWLQGRFFRWSRTEQLAPGRDVRSMQVVAEEPEDEDYRAGYLTGMTIGDGTFRYEPGWRSSRSGFPQAYWRVAMADQDPLFRLENFLHSFRIAARILPFFGGLASRLPMSKIEIRSIPLLAALHPLVTNERGSRSYRRGFVAGFFDAEGHNGTSLRFSQVDAAVLERVGGYAASLGFETQLERRAGCASTLRLVGGIADRIRFFSVVKPALSRKIARLFGRMPPLVPERIEAIEPGPRIDVVDIQTSTRTFYAAGLATHNCYARPSHEYLGFDAGLGFESRILVKEDAPELLRRTFRSARWQPQVVALSGNTDCYQPIERRLGITRRCLQVFADFRNPVGVITKSALVARDADLLAELARHRCAQVRVSVTTLDADLARRMEPRAATPARRLEAIAALASAGVPTGVLVAPIIPGLNDSEIPAILRAAADAGARTASWVLLRLAPPNDVLFVEWLDRHLPLRRDKVLHRIRETRAGRISDSAFGRRMRGQGEYARQIAALFDACARRHHLDGGLPELDPGAFRAPPEAGDQLDLL